MSPSLSVTVDAEELGFDADRLRRIDTHFDKYVTDGKIPGYLITVAREGEIAHIGAGGYRDVAAQAPVTADTIWRIYSMTKPITSVALMTYFEEGRFQLTDPVEWYIPSFAKTRVYAGGAAHNPTTVPTTEPIRIWHLLSHTAGLTYGFTRLHPCDEIHRLADMEFAFRFDQTLEEACDRWAEMPLLYQPGTRWSYSVATDVCGRLCEIFGGKPLDEVLAERVLTPLKMHDTTFVCREEEQHRMAELYATLGDGFFQAGSMAKWGKVRPAGLSGGGGLVSTAADYHRFTTMLLRGGELDGARILGPRTLDYMAANHLPGGVDLREAEVDGFSESAYDGVGFGLGFAVTLNPLASKMIASHGNFYWGGMASTAFFVDPTEQLTVQFFTQLIPSTTYPIRPELSQLVYQAIIE